MAEKVKFCQNSDQIRGLCEMVMQEPRGHAGQFGAILTEPVTPGAKAGVIFFVPGGIGGGMCGHGTMGVASALVDMGVVSGTLPLDFTLDNARGIITVRVNGHDDVVESVSFRNVPSFLYYDNVDLRVPGIGTIKADVSFGGNLYAFVSAKDLGIRVRVENLLELRRLGTMLIEAAQEQLPVESPASWISPFAIGGVMIRDEPLHPEADQKNILMGRVGFDRSPCGTGTSGWVAALTAKGKLPFGKEFANESVVGGIFRGKAVERTKVGRFDAIIPEITGSAYVVAYHDFVLDPHDPYPRGFQTFKE